MWKYILYRTLHERKFGQVEERGIDKVLGRPLLDWRWLGHCQHGKLWKTWWQCAKKDVTTPGTDESKVMNKVQLEAHHWPPNISGNPFHHQNEVQWTQRILMIDSNTTVKSFDVPAATPTLEWVLSYKYINIFCLSSIPCLFWAYLQQWIAWVVI